MDRYTIISTVGSEKITSNIEGGEFSYKKVLTNVTTKHFKLDIRFFDESKHVAVLVETKQRQKDSDKEQLFTYVALEQRWNKDTKINQLQKELEEATQELERELKNSDTMLKDLHEKYGEFSLNNLDKVLKEEKI